VGYNGARAVVNLIMGVEMKIVLSFMTELQLGMIDPVMSKGHLFVK
jgi:hypothetical protein